MIIATLYIDFAKQNVPIVFYEWNFWNISLDSNKYWKSCKIQLGVIFPKILCLVVEMTPCKSPIVTLKSFLTSQLPINIDTEIQEKNIALQLQLP